MNITVKKISSALPSSEVMIIPVCDTTKVTIISGLFSGQSLEKQIKNVYQANHFSGKKETSITLYSSDKTGPKKVILSGLGSAKKLTYNGLRCAAGTMSRLCKESASVEWYLPFIAEASLEMSLVVQCFSEGMIMGAYHFDHCKSKRKKKTLNKATIYAKSVSKSIQDGCVVGTAMGSAVGVARDLASLPANILTPTEFVNRAKKAFSKEKAFTLSVITEGQAKKLGMGSFLSVTKGSKEPGYLLVISYMPVKKGKVTALVGKGVTFDTGGISIKPSKSMSDMKADMSGAAAVYATMTALKTLKPKKNVLAVMPLTENMPSAYATRPGDVVTAMNGKSIEILNTDAEGRLILADALCYVVKQKVDEIIDIATLTGACSVALGDLASAILGNSQQMIDRLKDIGEFTGDRLWQLPLYDDYFNFLKSDVADMANCFEGRLGGTITAAKFLEQFVDKTNWVHLDIASTMDASKTSGYAVKGMQGSNTRNLIAYVMS